MACKGLAWSTFCRSPSISNLWEDLTKISPYKNWKTTFSAPNQSRYKTHQYYNFNKPPEVLHAWAAQFTQMVWVESSKFGCGKAMSRTGKIIVVANYFPKGNIPSAFHLNVLPPGCDSGRTTPSGRGDDCSNSQQDDRLTAKLARMFKKPTKMQG